jgi:hypothetical protein
VFVQEVIAAIKIEPSLISKSVFGTLEMKNLFYLLFLKTFFKTFEHLLIKLYLVVF